jgi:transposase
VPALPPYLIEPIWQQFSALLPERLTDHPLGCHRSRIPERIVFEKLVQVLVFGCAYERIADGSCSESTLRRRRDEWIELGVMEHLRQIALESYDRLIGLELSEVAVDGCTTKAPCGGEKAGRSPVDRGKGGIKRSMAVDARGIPLGTTTAPANHHDSPLLVPTLMAVSGPLGALPEGGERPPRPRLRLEEDSRAPSGTGARVGDLGEGQAGALLGHISVGGREDERMAQRPQEAGLVHGAGGKGDRLLGGLLRGGDHREAPHPRRLGSLPLGGATIPPTMIPIDGSSKTLRE